MQQQGGLLGGQPGLDTEDERKSLASESFISYAAHRELMHGPYVGIGIVY